MSTSLFLGRQPVLNRSQQVIGYELLFRGDEYARAADFNSDLEAGLSVLRGLLTSVNNTPLLGRKLAFINVGEQILHSEFLELLHPEHVVLECNIQGKPSSLLLKRLAHLHERGFNLAVDDFADEETLNAVLPWVKYVKLSLPKMCGQSLDVNTLSEVSQTLRKRHSAIQIVKHIETAEQFQACLEAGFDGFQGHYFARTEVVSVKTIHPQFSNILHLLNLLRNHASFDEIVAAVKSDLAMTYKLCCYLDSVGMTPEVQTIPSIREALERLGLQRFNRWLTLLLVSDGEETVLPSALLKMAVMRARFAELLGLKLEPSHTSDDYFFSGMFSLLGRILDMPCDEVLNNMRLSESVMRALQHREGRLGTVIHLLEALEEDDISRVKMLCDELGMTAEQINLVHVEALHWVEREQ